jgi:hypothetical protein
MAELERTRAAERGREPLFSEPVAWDEVGRSEGTDDDGGLVSPPTTSDDSEDSEDSDDEGECPRTRHLRLSPPPPPPLSPPFLFLSRTYTSIIA